MEKGLHAVEEAGGSVADNAHAIGSEHEPVGLLCQRRPVAVGGLANHNRTRLEGKGNLPSDGPVFAGRFERQVKPLRQSFLEARHGHVAGRHARPERQPPVARELHVFLSERHVLGRRQHGVAAGEKRRAEDGRRAEGGANEGHEPAGQSVISNVSHRNHVWTGLCAHRSSLGGVSTVASVWQACTGAGSITPGRIQEGGAPVL